MQPVQPWWSTRSFAMALILISAIPLILPGIPPLIDLPGHMGRYAVEIAPPHSPLHRYFEFRWALIGNLGLDLWVIPASKLFGLELAVKLIVLAIPPLTVAGMLLVAREVHGELPPTAALALPLAYGYPFQFGFVNFALSMALAILGFAFWLRLGRTGQWKLRTLLFLPGAILLWLVHSFGWGVLGLLAFSADFVRGRREGASLIAAARDAVISVIPLVPPVFLMLLWRSGNVAGMTGDWFNFGAKNYYLQSILRNEGGSFDYICANLLLLICMAGLLGRGFRRNAMLVMPACLLILAYLLLPRIAMGSAYADMRLAPYMIALLLLALTPKIADINGKRAIALLSMAFFVARIGEQTLSYLRLDAGYREQLAALDHVPAGARIFALTDLQCLGKPNSSRLDHIEALAIVRRQAFVNGQWVMAGAQLLRIDYPQAKGFSGDPTQVLRPGRCRQPGSYTYPAVLTQFPRAAFDYLWLINFVPDRRPKGDAGLIPVWQNARGALYRISRTPSAG